jgi:mono/diheme cytochrome c family protein
MRRLACFALASSLFHPGGAQALDVPEIFRKADLQQGERLLEENRCAACHAQKFGGDGSAIYRPAGRVNSPALLRGTVEQCNLNLNLSLFPEEVTDISAVLNRDHYRFKH